MYIVYDETIRVGCAKAVERPFPARNITESKTQRPETLRSRDFETVKVLSLKWSIKLIL